jgi:hypothetical protein
MTFYQKLAALLVLWGFLSVLANPFFEDKTLRNITIALFVLASLVWLFLA